MIKKSVMMVFTVMLLYAANAQMTVNYDPAVQPTANRFLAMIGGGINKQEETAMVFWQVRLCIDGTISPKKIKWGYDAGRSL